MAIEHEISELLSPEGRKIVLPGHTRGDVLKGWATGGDFVDEFSRLIADNPWTAVFWETPPVTTDTLEEPFEMVILDAPILDQMPVDYSFRGSLWGTDGKKEARHLYNMSGDTVLVVPTDPKDETDCRNLAAFLRTASPEHVRALWAEVADRVSEELSQIPLWVSTSGAGVAWLHVRIGHRPKYYQHKPYTQHPS